MEIVAQEDIFIWIVKQIISNFLEMLLYALYLDVHANVYKQVLYNVK